MKQITPGELHAIVGKLLVGDEIDDADTFSKFFTELAELACGYCGGYVTGPADDSVGEWLIGIERDDCMPEVSVWSCYDPEGDLDRS